MIRSVFAVTCSSCGICPAVCVCVRACMGNAPIFSFYTQATDSDYTSSTYCTNRGACGPCSYQFPEWMLSLQRENRFPSIGWLAGNMLTSKSWLKGHQTYTTLKLVIAYVWPTCFSNMLLYTNTSVERGSGFRIPVFSFQEAFGRPRSIQKLEAKSPTAFMHRRFSFTTHKIYINTH